MASEHAVKSAMTKWREGEEFGNWEYVIPEDYEYTDRSLPSADAWVQYTIKAGVYPVRLTEISYCPWNPDRDKPTQGFTANTGPYYAVVDADAIKTASHYVNRLGSASSVNHKTGLSESCTKTFTRYAYEVTDGFFETHGYFRKVA